jgi:hypothetical protein
MAYFTTTYHELYFLPAVEGMGEHYYFLRTTYFTTTSHWRYSLPAVEGVVVLTKCLLSL